MTRLIRFGSRYYMGLPRRRIVGFGRVRAATWGAPAGSLVILANKWDVCPAATPLQVVG